MVTRTITFTADARSVHLTDTDFSTGGVRSYYFEDSGPHEDPVVRTVREEFLANATTSGSVVVTAT